MPVCIFFKLSFVRKKENYVFKDGGTVITELSEPLTSQYCIRPSVHWMNGRLHKQQVDPSISSVSTINSIIV